MIYYSLHNAILASLPLKKKKRVANLQSTFVQVRKGTFSSDTLLPSARRWFSCRYKSTRISAWKVPPSKVVAHNVLPLCRSKNPWLRALQNARTLASTLLRGSANSPWCELWLFETLGDGKPQEMFDMESLDYTGCSSWKCCHIIVNKPKMKAPKGSTWQLRRQLWIRSGCARIERCHQSWPHSQINA